MTPYDPISQVTAYDDPISPGGPARPYDPDCRRGTDDGPHDASDSGSHGAAAGGRCFEGAR